MERTSPHFRLQEIASGIHVAVATDGGYALSNGTILDLGGTTVVFDSLLTPAAGLDLLRAAERTTGRRPAYLINSHWHGDRCRGNSAFAPAHIVSTAKTRDLIGERSGPEIKNDRTEARQKLADLGSGRTVLPESDRALMEGWYRGLMATPGDLAVPTPDLTIAPELTLHGSRRSLRVLTFGGGHSPSDVLAYVPEERIVILGDLLSVGFHPWLGDGDPLALVRILDRVLDLGVDRAVPGHGEVGGVRDIRQLQSYVRGLGARARALRRSGHREAPAEGEIAPPPSDGWKFASFYRENLAFVLGRTPAKKRS